MTTIHDLAGIGIGPFNLSLAAQLDSISGLDIRFFDRAPRFDWHPGMMLPGVELQTSFLKDLVTATNPTSPWSFVSYLVAHKRFYEFLNADFEAVPRREFASYLAWVAENLPALDFGCNVREVDFDGRHFTFAFDDGERRLARNLALGVGLTPHVPDWARPAIGSRAFHSSETACRLGCSQGRRFAIVGGGQSGAEIALHLLSAAPAGTEVLWISRRSNFQPLDDSPFADEQFTPSYVERFHALTEPRRRATVERQKLSGDGISMSTLRSLYRRLYELRHLGDGPHARLLPHREVLDLVLEGDEARLVMRNGFDGSIEMASADTIVLATGYNQALPDFIAPLKSKLALGEDGLFRLNRDFSVKWDGPADRRVFALNAGRYTHGIAEPQLSLMAWRSAVIVNALLGRRHFDLEERPPLVRWTSEDHPAPATMMSAQGRRPPPPPVQNRA
ncbi:lysine N(6)-hydroxylase/L-ornithine N(5)-oxygenase family protein [Nitratireductor sp. ZSWI3]|uniref:lysine N(6)-hydroxylase/L-ornithine N(5)-oxygenase family protein n=1 Tax=Nitratireductor sp. ZSWI3 TaxID=2966359 RepID=UPI0021502EEB|nr:SidA/IucD/PvdA family monooxygenase [Nitratireductor sp. ZSWI3]MCR4264869.1 SidA/IucD/PvdA family monooxygenase [Nitratireductor sp. ZSWI3]